MCGIAGIRNNDAATVDAGQLARMIGALRHRGPDACRCWTDGPVGLAHARLSIIDLTGGAQPMSTHDDRFSITFNGEIFNYLELRQELAEKGHTFLTRSDTEVVLEAYRAYGENCVERFNGQWAFAIWDQAEKKLFLSRDRMGVRPLFYVQTTDCFLFASEIKSLFASGRISPELDLIALNEIFTFWVTVPPRTAFKNVWQLPPAHSMVVQDSRVRIWQYWNLEYESSDEFSPKQEARLIEQLLSLILDATKLRLRSDVPVGAYLSGGIDSTFVTALTKSLVGDRLRTFSVSFADSEFDESPYQQEAAAFFSTEHSNVHCKYGDIAAIFPDVVRHAEQPIIRTAPAPLYLLARHVRQSGFKVVLTGEGADEVLGGYDIYKEAKIRHFWGRNLDSTWRPYLLKRLYPYLDGLQRQSPAYLKNFFSVRAEDLANPLFSHLPRWQLTAKLKMFYSNDVREALRGTDALAEIGERLPVGYAGWCYFNRAEYLETAYLLPGYILSSQGDRMAMAHSVEGRYPFLDYRLVDFAAKLSPKLKMKVLDQKHLLKAASRGLIPESIRRRTKQPFRAPDGKCFFGETAPDYVNDMLSEVSVKGTGVFDSTAVNALVSKFRRAQAIGTKDNMALVGILSTQLLLHHFTNLQRQRI